MREIRECPSEKSLSFSKGEQKELYVTGIGIHCASSSCRSLSGQTAARSIGEPTLPRPMQMSMNRVLGSRSLFVSNDLEKEEGPHPLPPQEAR